MEFHFHPLNDETRPLWDGFVSAHPWAWPGHDTAVVDFEVSRGERSLSMLALDERGRVAAVSPLFLSDQTQARLIRFRTLSTGHSLRGAPLIDPKLSLKNQALFWQTWSDRLLELAAEMNIDNITVGFPHLYGGHFNREIYPYMPLRDIGYEPGGNLTLIKDLSACDGDLLRSVKSGCRSSIRRAQASGARCLRVSERQAWLDLYALNEETFRDEPFSHYSRQTMEIIWDGFVERGLAHVFAIEFEGATIGALVTGGNRHSQYYWMSFNRKPMPLPGANNFLLFYAMDCLRGQGVRFMELGSLEFDDTRQKNIARFKRSFEGTIHPSMDGTLTVSELKMATADWLKALSRRLRGRKPGTTTKI